MVRIAPSILSADLLHLEDEIKAIERAGADQIHIDVMDGHFVPNLTFGPVLIEAIKRVSSIPLDVHLMINNPGVYLGLYAECGADFLTIHVESSIHLERDVREIKLLGLRQVLHLIQALTKAYSLMLLIIWIWCW